MLDRVYGSIPGRRNDGVSILLMPGERPRTPYPWKEYKACPHCGSVGFWEQNQKVGHCVKCCTWIFNIDTRPIKIEVAALPSPRERYAGPLVVKCVDCGTMFETWNKSTGKNATVRCPVCQINHKRQIEKKYQQTYQRKNRKLAASSDERAAGVVLKQKQFNARQGGMKQP